MIGQLVSAILKLSNQSVHREICILYWNTSLRCTVLSLRSYHLALVVRDGEISSIARLRLPERHESTIREPKYIAVKYLLELYTIRKRYLSAVKLTILDKAEIAELKELRKLRVVPQRRWNRAYSLASSILSKNLRGYRSSHEFGNCSLSQVRTRLRAMILSDGVHYKSPSAAWLRTQVRSLGIL